MAEGFALIDKAGEWTSHDVVAKCRGIFRERRIGHAGTLDPMATGLLVLGVGKATRLMRFIQDGTKHYEATVAFGIATDTLDADGAILDREPMDFTESDLVATAERFVGTISQVPPMVSAIRMGGRRLYELAREGVEVEREARTVTIHSITVTDFSPGPYPTADIVVSCGSGTYVRSLADDLAQALGGRAHLASLRRTAIGIHDVARAFTVEQLDALDDPSSVLVSLADGLGELPALSVSGDTATAVGHGRVFTDSTFGAGFDGPFRVLGEGGELLAVYGRDGRRAKPEVVTA